MVPVQRHGQLIADEEVAAKDVGPVDDGVEFAGEAANGVESGVGRSAGVAEREDGIAIEDAAGDAAEAGELADLPSRGTYRSPGWERPRVRSVSGSRGHLGDGEVEPGE
jgi:hypothetical protein